MTSEPYKVGDVHPSAEQPPLRPGDTVLVTTAWGARCFIVDVDHQRQRARLRTQNGAELYARLADLERVAS